MCKYVHENIATKIRVKISCYQVFQGVRNQYYSVMHFYDFMTIVNYTNLKKDNGDISTNINNVSCISVNIPEAVITDQSRF